MACRVQIWCRNHYGVTVSHVRHREVGLDPFFVSEFNHALQLYHKGDWADAKVHLNRALKTRPSDGPSKTLMGVLADGKFKAPANWKGYRALTSK